MSWLTLCNLILIYSVLIWTCITECIIDRHPGGIVCGEGPIFQLWERSTRLELCGSSMVHLLPHDPRFDVMHNALLFDSDQVQLYVLSHKTCIISISHASTSSIARLEVLGKIRSSWQMAKEFKVQTFLKSVIKAYKKESQWSKWWCNGRKIKQDSKDPERVSIPHLSLLMGSERLFLCSLLRIKIYRKY